MTQANSYRRLVELSPDGILISQDGILVFANPAAGRLCGAADPAELVGHAARPTSSTPTGTGRAGRASSGWLAGDAVTPFEEQIVRPDGGISRRRSRAHARR